MAPDEASLAPLYDQVQKRVPVFASSSSSSEIVGYDYTWIGFVDRDTAESGGFDARAKRIELHGCDPAADDPAAAESCLATITASN